MAEKFRHRLIGAIVWISLAVIFFPAIFDGAGYRDLKRADMNFSDEPKVEIERYAPASEDRFRTMHERLDIQQIHKREHDRSEPAKNKEADLPSSDGQKATDRRDKKTASDKAAGKRGGKTAAANKLKPDLRAKPLAAERTAVQVKPDPPAPASEALDKPTVRSASDRKQQSPEGKPSGPWIIETTAYNNKRSADHFIARLKQAGYPARLKSVVAPEYTFFVVEIGPIEQLGLLKEVQAYLSERHSINNARVQPAG